LESGWGVLALPLRTHMYSWFIDLYFPCTGYNLYKNTTYIHAEKG
jgi:hypothetical protein